VGSIPTYQMLQGHHDVAFYRAGYRGEIAYVDQEIGRLLAEVERLGLAHRSVVVFAADHGESLGEGDVWFAHGARLTDEQVRVPLFLRLPGREPAHRSDVVSLVDLRPTLLALVAGAAPEPGLPGRDLLAPGAERGSTTAYMATLGAASQPERALVDGDYKLIVPERGGDGEHLHRLGHEDVDLRSAAPEVAARMRQRLAEERGRFAPGVSETPQALSAEERATLGALGYVAAEGDAAK
jgi:arylsulfatase A-like enzyme